MVYIWINGVNIAPYVGLALILLAALLISVVACEEKGFVMMDTKQLIAALEMWAPLVGSGYEVPAAEIVMLQAAKKLHQLEKELERMIALHHDAIDQINP